MHFSSKNPYVMKSSAQPKFYFSAYPLKAIKQTDEEKVSYLHIETNRNGKVKYTGSLKVMPMVNPYSEKEEAQLSERIKNQSDPNKIEETDRDWFASYE